MTQSPEPFSPLSPTIGPLYDDYDAGSTLSTAAPLFTDHLEDPYQQQSGEDAINAELSVLKDVLKERFREDTERDTEQGQRIAVLEDQVRYLRDEVQRLESTAQQAVITAEATKIALRILKPTTLNAE